MSAATCSTSARPRGCAIASRRTSTAAPRATRKPPSWSVTSMRSKRVRRRSALDAALYEARLIRELKPPVQSDAQVGGARLLRQTGSLRSISAPANQPEDQRARRRDAARAVHRAAQSRPCGARDFRACSGLRTCARQARPDEDFSPCIYGQMGHCAAPCNLTIDDDAYNERVGTRGRVSARPQRSV